LAGNSKRSSMFVGSLVAAISATALLVLLYVVQVGMLLFAWPLFFNAPLFWVMFASDGRFYSAIPIALLVAGLPLLFERPFYACLAARPWRTASVLAGAGILAVAAWPFHDWLLRADAFHYWTPLLDPSKSALSGFK